MLRTHGQERRIALQASFHEEKGGAGRSAEDAGGGTGEDVDAEGLHGGVFVDEGRTGFAQGFVEAEAAAIKDHLVDVLRRLQWGGHKVSMFGYSLLVFVCCCLRSWFLIVGGEGASAESRVGKRKGESGDGGEVGESYCSANTPV